MSTFTPEQVRDLAIKLSHEDVFDYAKLITEWLEQNPIEPVFVGLTDEQVTQFIEKYNIHPLIGVHLKDWQKTQTFAQPEVREVPVGISDEQAYDLSKMVNNLNGSANEAEIAHSILYWLEHQIFTQPSEAFKAAMEEIHIRDEEIARLERLNQSLHDSLVDSLEQLKAQQFTPDWSAAPASAVTCQVVKYFLDDKNNQVDSEILKIEFRPKPTVKVGQVWRHGSEGEGGDDYEVTEVTTLEGKFKIGDEWQEDVVMITYENTAQDVYRRTLSDFLAKFSQVV